METKEIVKLKRAAVVTKDSLEACHKVLVGVAKQNEAQNRRPSLKERFGVTYSASLADEARVTFNSFEELVGFANRRDRRIVRLKALVEPQRNGIDVEVEYGGFSEVFSATIAGEVGEALKVKDQLKDVAAHISPWYAIMYSWIAMIAVPIIVWCLLVYVLPSGTAKDVGDSLGLLLWMGFLGIGGLLGALRWLLFPRITFALGQERDRNEARVYWRRWVLTAVILGLPLAVLGKAIAHWVGIGGP